MKQCIVCSKWMVISFSMLISGVVSAANSAMVGKDLSNGSCVLNSSVMSSDSPHMNDIKLLSELETFELGLKIFGGEKGITGLGSGFSQTAPGATWDIHPSIDTKTLPQGKNIVDLDGTTDEIRGQIIRLLGKPDLTSIRSLTTEAQLHFVINQKNEIVVLTVDTDDQFIDNYLKTRLNYKVLPAGSAGIQYKMKVTLKNS
ncbi:MAG: hypothetical protein OEM26_03260 [Saprospiraceae bacterium]|nr:hypothetical protein [Saprospiraceae bacterium]